MIRVVKAAGNVKKYLREPRVQLARLRLLCGRGRAFPPSLPLPPGATSLKRPAEEQLDRAAAEKDMEEDPEDTGFAENCDDDDLVVFADAFDVLAFGPGSSSSDSADAAT